MVVNNRLKRKGTLDFNFKEGGCTVLNQHIIVLCFGGLSLTDRKVCRQSKNPFGPFMKMPESNHNHRAIRIASFDGKNKIYRKINSFYLRYTDRSWR